MFFKDTVQTQDCEKQNSFLLVFNLQVLESVRSSWIGLVKRLLHLQRQFGHFVQKKFICSKMLNHLL